MGSRRILVVSVCLLAFMVENIVDASSSRADAGRDLGVYFPSDDQFSQSSSTDFHNNYDGPIFASPSESSGPVRNQGPKSSDSSSRNSNYQPTHSSFDRYPPVVHHRPPHHKRPQYHPEEKKSSNLKKFILIGLAVMVPLILIMGLATFAPLVINGIGRLTPLVGAQNAGTVGRKRRSVQAGFEPEAMAHVQRLALFLDDAIKAFEQ